jgi:hypothetical protein
MTCIFKTVILISGEGRSPNGQGRLTLFDLAQFSNLAGVPLCESALWIERYLSVIASAALPPCEPTDHANGAPWTDAYVRSVTLFAGQPGDSQICKE